jgi:hypothetical protein
VRRPVAALLVLSVLTAGCASTTGDRHPPPIRATDFRPTEIRRPAVLIRLRLAELHLTERQAKTVPGDYEGALLEGFNTRAVLVKDTRVVSDRDPVIDTPSALARAREVAADTLVVVDAEAQRQTIVVCEDTPRPRRGQATVLRQRVEVVRVSDGATRLRIVDSPSLDVPMIDVDCDTGRARDREINEMLSDGTERLLERLLGR